jgi:hypothetical protein
MKFAAARNADKISKNREACENAASRFFFDELGFPGSSPGQALLSQE